MIMSTHIEPTITINSIISPAVYSLGSLVMITILSLTPGTVAIENAPPQASTTSSSSKTSVSKTFDLQDGEITDPVCPSLTCSTTNPQLSEIIFLNGRNTTASEAMEQTIQLSEQLALGEGVRLIFNSLTLPVFDDFAIMWDKFLNANVSLNAATDTLTARIEHIAGSHQEIAIIAYSAGTIIVNNVVRELAHRNPSLLSHVHILLVGSAVLGEEQLFADGWPQEIASLHTLMHSGDWVVQTFGPGHLVDHSVENAHDYASYLPHFNPQMLIESGKTKIDYPQESPRVNSRRHLLQAFYQKINPSHLMLATACPYCKLTSTSTSPRPSSSEVMALPRMAPEDFW